MRRWVAFIFKIAVSATLIGVLLYSVGAKDVLGHVRAIDTGWFMLAMAAGFTQIVLCAARWRAVLAAIGAPLPFKDAYVLWYIGAFFNQTLPSAVGGDVVRGYMTYKRGVALAPAINSLILERVATLLALLALVAVSSLLAGDILKGADAFTAAAWAALAAGVVGVAVLMVFDRLSSRLSRFQIAAALVGLAEGARALLLKPRNAADVLGWSLAGHVNLCVAAFCLARSVDVEVELAACLVLFPPVMLAQVLPISLAGWGVREGAMVVLFALAGVSGEQALAVSILFGIMMAMTSLPGVASWMAMGRHTAGEADAFAERAKAQ